MRWAGYVDFGEVPGELIDHLPVLGRDGCHGKIGPLVGIHFVIVKLFGPIVIADISPTFSTNRMILKTVGADRRPRPG